MTTPNTRLEPEIAEALEKWLLVMMREQRGSGHELVVYKGTERKIDNSYTMTDVFTAINEVCPDAIARLLQAGAAAYITQDKDDI